MGRLCRLQRASAACMARNGRSVLIEAVPGQSTDLHLATRIMDVTLKPALSKTAWNASKRYSGGIVPGFIGKVRTGHFPSTSLSGLFTDAGFS